ncbi:TIM-barrel domain-containing protein [Liquorilactobacillus vini]|uniref:glycoside hydrolase family 31 protein n=1 Tax=Liquorilactobacillus vini TaxID=238015 RepID=UPI0002FD7A16|nr:TIM-barrel domain-containing protein [Liquorilactobacillus vini]
MTKQITGQNFRFTLLTDRLLRIEYQVDGQFTDEVTQTVINRDFAQPEWQVMTNQAGFALQIETAAFHLYYRGGEFNGVNLFIDTKYNYQTHFSRWHFGDSDPENLGGTVRTLDNADGAVPVGQGILSKNGLAVLDDSASLLQHNGQLTARKAWETDQYLFIYGHDYLAALNDYFQLTGFPPLIPRYALGNWWSRYYSYTQVEYLKLMDKFREKQIPLSVAVLDMNWHTTKIPVKYGSGWTGFTWDKQLFSNPEKMISQLHAQGKHVTLNLHPAAGIRPSEAKYPQVARENDIDPKTHQTIPFNLTDPKFVHSYFETVLHPLEQQGVDFWWIDWQQGTALTKDQPDPLWLLNDLHYHDQLQRKSTDALILSRYAGPGSHRYPIGFSGDTVANWKSLDFQPYFTATASNIGYTWWSHDIGGHMRGQYDPELSLRWLQLGVFSPILRLHSTDNPFMSKEPWNYELTIQQAMIKFLQLRAKLLPYLESANLVTHQQGIPLIQPLYYQEPEQELAYHFKNEYFFGSEMLIVPITQPGSQITGLGMTKAYLPAGTWTDWLTGQRYQGPGIVTLNRQLDQYPILIKNAGIIVTQPDFLKAADQLPVNLVVELFPGETNHYVLAEHQQQKIAQTIFDWNQQSGDLTIQLRDPQRITPLYRCLEIKLVNLRAAQTTFILRNMQPGKTYCLHFGPCQLQEPDWQKRMFEILQHSKISFDLKEVLWQMIQTLPPKNLLATLTSIAPADLLAALSEILLAK